MGSSSSSAKQPRAKKKSSTKTSVDPERNGKHSKERTSVVARADVTEGYCPDAVQVGALSVKQRTNLKLLFQGLRDSHAQLENGRHVDHYRDVIRYLLENIS